MTGVQTCALPISFSSIVRAPSFARLSSLANKPPTTVDVLKTLFIVSDVKIHERIDAASHAWHYSKVLPGPPPSSPPATQT